MGTKSTKEENFSKEHRLLKKDILDMLVVTFPAGNSLTLVVALGLIGAFGGGAKAFEIFRSLRCNMFRGMKNNNNGTHDWELCLVLFPLPEFSTAGSSSSSRFRLTNTTFIKERSVLL